MLGVASVFFFLLTATIASQFDASMYPSPDETAASVFAKRIAVGESMPIAEPSNQHLEQIVHPRSTTVVGATIVPQGFPLQFFLWGWLTRLSGLPIWVWTPVLAALSLPVLFALFRLVFPTRIAFTATLLAFVHPAVLYYTSRGLYPNAPQLFVLFWSLWFLASSKPWKWAVGGALLALAIAFRPSEILWMSIVAAFVVSVQRQRLTPYHLFAGALGFLGVAGLAFSFYRAVYGAALIGYRVPRATNASIHFGISSAGAILRHAWDYLAVLFWWLTIPAAGGLVALLRTQQISNVQVRRYGMFFCAVAIPLLLLYGSWDLRDSVSEQSITIGTSFVRYWLPLSILALPLIVYGLEQIRAHSVLLCLLLLASLLYPTVWGFESLARDIGVSQQDALLRDEAKTVLPAHAVLLLERSDKIFWPTYPVIVGALEPEKVLHLLPRVAASTPVYLHRVSSLSFGSFWNAEHLGSVGLAFGQPIALDADNELIPLVPLQLDFKSAEN